jgi:hypothetical protein
MIANELCARYALCDVGSFVALLLNLGIPLKTWWLSFLRLAMKYPKYAFQVRDMLLSEQILSYYLSRRPMP